MLKKTEDIYYQNIANAIRLKNGEETLYKPPQMAAAIEAIPSGGSTDGQFYPMNMTEYVLPKMTLTYNGEEI